MTGQNDPGETADEPAEAAEHGHDHEPAGGAPHVRRIASRRTTPTPEAFDPFARVYTDGGQIDREYASKRLPLLVEMLRRHPACFPVRIDVDDLSRTLLADDAAPVRDAPDEAAFEGALRAFSESHLHELVSEETQKALHGALTSLARDAGRPRRDRAAAAVGLAILGAPPDRRGLRGRGLFDLVLRVTMEEQTAQEQLRKKARESDDGLTPAELEAFWNQYPALRWRHEQRYRREVTAILHQIERGEIPPAISVDLGLRGAAILLAEVAKARAAGGIVEAKRAESILREPFVDDVLDEGGPLVVERWLADAAHAEGMASDERRAFVRHLETAARIVAEGGPGADPVLFYLYLRAVVQGHYHVRDDAELEAAKPVFGVGGLSPEGVVGYADHLGARGDAAAQRRVILAAIELWPDHAGVRSAAEAFGDLQLGRVGGERLGPRYDEETGADAEAPPAS